MNGDGIFTGILAFESRGESDGTVIRWYVETAPTRRNLIASASRRHVRFHRDDIPARVRDAAHGAHRELAGNPNADIRHYLTPAAEVTP
ncbi:MAG TPA: hypothetical protein VHX38_18845 [Pseudonocardiaceae bacterium]|nr:hypothetical protein [Pseudonocardiaceae bacterium]